MAPGRGVSQRWAARGQALLTQGGRFERVRRWGTTARYLISETWCEWGADDGGTRAAALGYYALFSLFPITVLLALGLTFLVGESVARLEVRQFAAQYIPTGYDLVDEVVGRVLDNRGTISVIALVAIFWGCTQIFRVLERAINRAWGTPRRRNFWRNLLFSFVMIVTIGVLTGISLMATALFDIAQPLNLPFVQWAPLENRLIWLVVSALPPFALTMTLFILLYRYVPHGIHVPWKDVLPSAFLAALFWELAKRAYAFYLTNFVRQGFDVLYGSFGALIGLMTWVYLAGYIILMGAEFCAVLSRYRREQESPRAPVWAAPPSKP